MHLTKVPTSVDPVAWRVDLLGRSSFAMERSYSAPHGSSSKWLGEKSAALACAVAGAGVVGTGAAETCSAVVVMAGSDWAALPPAFFLDTAGLPVSVWAAARVLAPVVPGAALAEDLAGGVQSPDWVCAGAMNLDQVPMLEVDAVAPCFGA